MGGATSRQQARRAAEASEQQRRELQEQRRILEERTRQQALKAQKILIRAFQSRGAGFFESASNQSLSSSPDTLG